jgi:uncharacterized protein YdaU (DUF1376 family)
MKANSWMPLYVNDYLGDTMSLSTEQHGAYLLLMMAAWKAGGPLPDNDAQLAAIAKMTPSAWRKAAPAIRAFFQAKDGQLIQGRLLREAEKAQRLSDARRETGRLGGRPRKPIGFDLLPDSFSNVVEIESKIEAKSKLGETPSDCEGECNLKEALQ